MTPSVLYLLLFYAIGSRASGEPCDVAQAKCSRRMGCGMALNQYLVSCGELMHGQTDRCSKDCQSSLASMLSIPEGNALATCDCNGDGAEHCRQWRRRLTACEVGVLQAMSQLSDPDARVSCSLAQLVCAADSACQKAMDYYLAHCGRLVRGKSCTSRCNNSIAILYRQPGAHKLPHCRCDGLIAHHFDCHLLQENTQTLCLNRHRHHKPRHHHELEQTLSSDYPVWDDSYESISEIQIHLINKFEDENSHHSSATSTANISIVINMLSALIGLLYRWKLS